MISGTTEEGNHLTEQIPYFFPPFCFFFSGGAFLGGPPVRSPGGHQDESDGTLTGTYVFFKI